MVYRLAVKKAPMTQIDENYHHGRLIASEVLKRGVCQYKTGSPWLYRLRPWATILEGDGLKSSSRREKAAVAIPGR
jgi:hypothetical protein